MSDHPCVLQNAWQGGAWVVYKLKAQGLEPGWHCLEKRDAQRRPEFSASHHQPTFKLDWIDFLPLDTQTPYLAVKYIKLALDYLSYWCQLSLFCANLPNLSFFSTIRVTQIVKLNSFKDQQKCITICTKLTRTHVSWVYQIHSRSTYTYNHYRLVSCTELYILLRQKTLYL